MSSAKNVGHSPKGGRSAGPFRKAPHALLLAAWIAVPLIAQGNGGAQLVGFPADWSHNHLIFTEGGSRQSQLDAQRDPRYWMQQMRRSSPLLGQRLPQQVASSPDNAAAAGAEIAPRRPPGPERPRASTITLQRDWNFSLLTAAANGGVAPGQFPAKWTFNPIAGASCANDFVIYGLNTGGGAGQPNLVGVNNLYVGPAGTGCSAIANNGGSSNTYPTPQVLWAFNVSTSPILTSPVLSLDGTKVAYVVNTPTNPTLQVLTLPIGTQSGTINIPTAPSTTCGAPAPSICSLTLSSSGDSNSSLFVDYSTDTAYVGGDNGWLDKITGAFNATPALAGGLWPVSAGSMFLGSPVYDSITQTVFVGSYDGNLYGFTSGGDGITGSPLALAASAGGSQGLYYAPPIVDSTNHVLYAFYGDNATTSLAGCTSANTCAEVAQVVYYDKTAAKVEFESGAGTPGSASTAVAGTNLAAFLTTNGAATFVIADGAFSYGYFTSFPSTTSTSFLYACGATGISTGVGLQQFGFNGSGQLSATVTQVANITSSTAAEFPCSPATEFYNTSTNTDYLFLSVPVLNEVQSYILPGYGGSSGSMSAAATSATVVGGASGIIVDGADPFLNASSVYFTSELTGTCTDSGNASPANSGIGSASSAICAYKLTQRRLD